MFSVSRYHDKFDGMLSYVGGLFALIFGWIFFFVGSFSEYRYELSVAENTFAMDESGKKMREKSFGFLTYVQYAIYDWLRTFNIKVDWKKVEEINEVREEATEQMDVRYVLKQLQHFSKVNRILLEEHRLICSHLTKHPTLAEVKKMRKICQYYDKVILDETELSEKQEPNLKNFERNNFESEMASQDLKVIENDSDFDSDDEEAENTIVEGVVQSELKKDPLIEEIPKNLLHRLKMK